MTALLSEDEAAQRLLLSPRTLRDLRAKGMIRYIRTSPRKIAYTPDDIAEFIAKHRCQDEPLCTKPNRTRRASGRTGNVVPFSKLA